MVHIPKVQQSCHVWRLQPIGDEHVLVIDVAMNATLA
jgi:hypothetical protein